MILLTFAIKQKDEAIVEDVKDGQDDGDDDDEDDYTSDGISLDFTSDANSFVDSEANYIFQTQFFRYLIA